MKKLILILSGLLFLCGWAPADGGKQPQHAVYRGFSCSLSPDSHRSGANRELHRQGGE